MAVGLPAKTTYVDGDVFSASDINDTNGTLNLVGQTTNFYAGKNRLLNSDFSINQRNFTSNTTSGLYNFDRWIEQNLGGTVTVTPQTFTPGAAPVTGYEGTNFVRIATTGQTTQSQYAFLEQRIEDVRTFANQTVTLSFWAKASSGTPYLWAEYTQNFGSGGSAQVFAQIGATQTISTTWTRYSVTVTIPSISGKTIGSNNYLTILLWTSAGSSIRGFTSATFQNSTIDIWGVQIEAGSTATAFETATGNPASELDACNRYYFRVTKDTGIVGHMFKYLSSDGMGFIELPVQMRVTPTSMDISNVQFQQTNLTNNGIFGPTLNAGYSTNKIAAFTFGQTGLANGTQGYAAIGTAAGFIGFSAEL
jgi:hypothetical protein